MNEISSLEVLQLVAGTKAVTSLNPVTPIEAPVTVTMFPLKPWVTVVPWVVVGSVSEYSIVTAEVTGSSELLVATPVTSDVENIED